VSTTVVEIAAEYGAGVVRTREGLLAALSVIAEEGWDGPTWRALLAHVRTDVVRPHVASLRGLAAEQAEASGWETVWEALAGPAIRRARSPWGVLWTTARRAVVGEVIADAYGVRVRTAWRRARRDVDGPVSGRQSRFDDPGGQQHHLGAGFILG